MSGRLVPAFYFERDYLHGLATDKLPRSKYLESGYADRLAGLLGRAAAANMIVGRALEGTKQLIFDDGDEVIIENPVTGLPDRLVVSDPSGAFSDYQRSLIEAAPAYARPINVRADSAPDLREFAETYLDAFKAGFLHVKGDYRKTPACFRYGVQALLLRSCGKLRLPLGVRAAPARSNGCRRHCPRNPPAHSGSGRLTAAAIASA